MNFKTYLLPKCQQYICYIICFRPDTIEHNVHYFAARAIYILTRHHLKLAHFTLHCKDSKEPVTSSTGSLGSASFCLRPRRTRNSKQLAAKMTTDTEKMASKMYIASSSDDTALFGASITVSCLCCCASTCGTAPSASSVVLVPS